jgi:hypothetical protein
MVFGPGRNAPAGYAEASRRVVSATPGLVDVPLTVKRSRRTGSVRVQSGGDTFTSSPASADASNGLLGEPVDESREDGGQPRRRRHDP